MRLLAHELQQSSDPDPPTRPRHGAGGGGAEGMLFGEEEEGEGGRAAGEDWGSPRDMARDLLPHYRVDAAQVSRG